jgi:hypothetical protein
MKGLAGYVADLGNEMNRLLRTFRGGIICLPGVPLLLGGCNDPMLIRSIIELSRWLKSTGNQYPKRALDVVCNSLGVGKGVGFFLTEKIKIRLPGSLNGSGPENTYVSGGWASPRGALPLTVAHETEIISTLIEELNASFEVGLSPHVIIDKLCTSGADRSRKFLVIGGSHAVREGNLLADRGHEVILCAVRGWRANRGAAENMAKEVEAGLAEMSPDDIILVHCMDNTAYMGRTEEGGDLPIRKYASGEFHVEGELVLASRDRLFMFFKNCLPFLQLLVGRKVVFLSPLPRYLYASCCDREDHVSNKDEDDFAEKLRKNLGECRDWIKDFLFTSDLRGCKILNPGKEIPVREEGETVFWGDDPIHPTYEGYNRIIDAVVEEADRMSGILVKKRAGGSLNNPPKRPKLDLRPRWVEDNGNQPLWRADMQGNRGGFRGRSFDGSGPWRGRGRGGRGYQHAGYSGKIKSWGRGRGGNSWY